MMAIVWPFSPNERLQLVYLDDFRGSVVRHALRQRSSRRGDPVGDALGDAAEDAPDGALAHPFEIESDGLFVDGGAVPLFFRLRGEVALAGGAAVALRTGVVAPGFDGRRGAAAGAGDGGHGRPPGVSERLAHAFSRISLPLATPRTRRGVVVPAHRVDCRWDAESMGRGRQGARPASRGEPAPCRRGLWRASRSLQ